jgi:hypothetical protein
MQLTGAAQRVRIQPTSPGCATVLFRLCGTLLALEQSPVARLVALVNHHGETHVRPEEKIRSRRCQLQEPH